MSAAQDLPSITRSRLFILPSVGPLRQLRVPCWRRDMSNRFSALSSYAGAIVTPRRGRLMPDRHCLLASDEESWDHSRRGRCKNPALRVTFDDHDHLNIRDRSGGRQSLTCGSRAKRIGRGPVLRRRLKCGIALSP
jgi:hypothetical protein